MLALQLAWRFPREGRTQSLLILAGVTIGIAAFVFVSAIIEGLQVNLLDKTLGIESGLDSPGLFAVPVLVAVVFNGWWNLGAWSHPCSRFTRFTRFTRRIRSRFADRAKSR